MIDIQYFVGKKVGIVSMHHKHEILQNELKQELKLIPFLVTNINTDEFGTFSGEIERKLSALDTLRLKCEAGKIRHPEIDLFLASEGSFGAHPDLFFSAANEELILIKDFSLDKEYMASYFTSNTNYSNFKSNDISQVKQFIQQVGFPRHGILIKDSTESNLWHKEITSWNELDLFLENCQKKASFIEVQTDMRAHRNPTRQESIKTCLNKLIASIKTTCPSCNSVYFNFEKTVPGLPCKACSMPTKTTLKHLYKCHFCSYEKEILHPRNLKYEDPQFCDFCNP